MKFDAATSNEVSKKAEKKRILKMETEIVTKIWSNIEGRTFRGEYQAKLSLDFRKMFRPKVAYKIAKNYLYVLRSHGYDAEMKASGFGRGYVITVEW